MEIVWSEEILRNYLGVLDYLFEHCSVKEIESFESTFDDLIARLK